MAAEHVSARSLYDTNPCQMIGCREAMTRKVTIALGWLALLGLTIWVVRRHRQSMQTARLATAICNQMGVEYSTPWIQGREVIVVTRVDARGRMARAGVRVGDELHWRSLERLCSDVIERQGKILVIAVVREGRKVTIRLRIPRFTEEVR